MLVKSHNFYVEQAKKRLLSQFDNMEAEADSFGEEWIEETYGQSFDPEYDDPADHYEEAYDVSINFYQMLDNVRKNTRLSVVAGMFHEWDKQLRYWTAKEVRSWNYGEEVKSAIWKVGFECLIDLFEGVGWQIRSRDYYVPLHRCRLVVNAYKHGDGIALEEIRKNHSEFLTQPLSFGPALLSYANHEDLKIEESHIDEFSNAIIQFWNDVPDRIPRDDNLTLPDWFIKAHAKDSKGKAGI